MAIQLQNSTFIHIPKTGGIWTKRCLERHADIRSNHDFPDYFKALEQYSKGAHLTPDIDDNKGVFLFVRKPCDWLGSLFSHRKYKNWNWDDRNELELRCKSDNFDGFIDNVCRNEGVVEEYFNQYIRKYEINNDLQIGRQENLCDDLIKILHYFNEPFDRRGIKRMALRKHNKSSKKFGFRLKLTEDQKNKVYFSQKSFYNKYYE